MSGDSNELVFESFGFLELCLPFGTRFVLELLQVTAFGDVAVNLQDRCRVASLVTHQYLAAFDDHLSPIAATMNQLTLPLSLLLKVHIEVLTWLRKARLEQGVCYLTSCLLFCPS